MGIKFTALQEGTKIRCTTDKAECLCKGKIYTVQKDAWGGLRITCKRGEHSLYEDCADDTGEFPEFDEVKD